MYIQGLIRKSFAAASEVLKREGLSVKWIERDWASGPCGQAQLRDTLPYADLLVCSLQAGFNACMQSGIRIRLHWGRLIYQANGSSAKPMAPTCAESSDSHAAV